MGFLRLHAEKLAEEQPRKEKDVPSDAAVMQALTDDPLHAEKLAEEQPSQEKDVPSDAVVMQALKDEPAIAACGVAAAVELDVPDGASASVICENTDVNGQAEHAVEDTPNAVADEQPSCPAQDSPAHDDGTKSDESRALAAES